MKTVFGFIALIFSLNAQAQIGDQRLTFLKCTGGTGNKFTTLTLSRGGFFGGTFARIDQGKFQSGDIFIEQFTGPMIPENRMYVDLKTKGKVFSLNYSFLNPGSPARLVYRDSTRQIPVLPVLSCVETK